MLREQKWVLILCVVGLLTTVYLLHMSTTIKISSSKTLVIQLALPFAEDGNKDEISGNDNNKVTKRKEIEASKQSDEYLSSDRENDNNQHQNFKNWMKSLHDKIKESRNNIEATAAYDSNVVLNNFDQVNDESVDAPFKGFDDHPMPGPYVEEILQSMQSNNLNVDPSRFGDKKVILMITPAFESRLWWDTPEDYGMTDNNGQPCPETRCTVTYDRSQFIHSDLVFFHGRDIRDIDASSLHTLRKLSGDQIWVWSFMESPVNLFYEPQPYDGLFDWTATYKRKSDFWTPYYRVVRVKKKIKHHKTNIAETRSKLVAALQSSCDGFRIDLLRQMKRYVKVDVYGQCADRFSDSDFFSPCQQPHSDDCKETLSKYKFIIAVENSYCDEYVTEKYYKNGLLQGLVPIVMITPKFIHKRKYFIPGSYVNIADFSSMKKFADYLHYLDKNDTAYNEYFQWKNKYKIKKGPHRACLACKKLWEMDKKKERFVHSNRVDLSDFWSTKSCEVWDGAPPSVFAKYLHDSNEENNNSSTDSSNNHENNDDYVRTK